MVLILRMIVLPLIFFVSVMAETTSFPEVEVTEDKGFLDQVFEFLPFIENMFFGDADDLGDNSTETVDEIAVMVTELETTRASTEPPITTTKHMELLQTSEDTQFRADQQPQEMAWLNKTTPNITASGLCRDFIAATARCDVNARCLVSTVDRQGYVCACLEGFIDRSPDPRRQGQVCEEEDPDPLCQDFCYNGGACMVISGEPRCRCFDHYTGHRCEVASFVIFIVFVSVLGSLSMVMVLLACSARIRRMCKGVVCCCYSFNKKQRLVEEEHVNIPKIVVDRPEPIQKRDILSVY